MPHTSDVHTSDVPDDAPPFLRTWRRVYTATLIYFVLIVSACWLFTWAYR